MADTIRELLAPGPAEAPAIGAPDRPTLSHGALRTLVGATVAALRARGIGPRDTVAIVLPNGPEMAAVFLAIGAGATTAPLNPAYRFEEFKFFLEDLGARLLVVAQGAETPARTAADGLGIPVVEVVVSAGAPAGQFTLVGESGRAEIRSGPDTTSEDIALMLHTSGTTSRPKLVPLSHRNVCASAGHIVTSLELSADDCCLNIMPLFHIHGLMAAVLASLAAGGSVWCSPGFNALAFFAWMQDVRPTWVTGVPTMHQAILTRAERHRASLGTTQLRFVRSSSASLAPAVLRQMEEVFGVPVVEAYGMTEAAHQMASNPLPPGVRRAGSVGLAAGPQVAVMDEIGRLVGTGETGEVVIRGDNVMRGYRGNAEANRTAFVDGWFRTGDQGHLDADGYLWLTGRLKELINRGGEKISPREVDERLLEHAAVEQAVTFAVPHPKLGEEVAAAVIVKAEATITARELKAFVADRLADFKVPRQVLFLDEIPKGPTGKIQRIGLAEKLGLT